MQHFLDKSGLERVWEHIKTYIGKKIYSPDDTLTLSQENVLGVRLPTRSATKAEFDNMSDQQKQGFVVVTDEDVTKPNSGGSNGGEVYSTDEVRIGTWIDGKPIYRRVLEANLSVNSSSSYKNLCVIKNLGRLIRAYGYGKSSDGIYINCNSDATALAYLSNETVRLYVSSSTRFVSDGYIVLEYTKTTD